MKRSSMASKPCSLVCPLCEAGRLHTLGHDKARCDSCLGPLSGAMLEALSEIAILQNAVGSHACECGHPRCDSCLTGCSTARPAVVRYFRSRPQRARARGQQRAEGLRSRRMVPHRSPCT